MNDTIKISIKKSIPINLTKKPSKNSFIPIPIFTQCIFSSRKRGYPIDKFNFFLFTGCNLHCFWNKWNRTHHIGKIDIQTTQKNLYRTIKLKSKG